MATRPMRWLAGLATVVTMWAGFATQAAAHPHVFITFETTVLYEKGTFVGVRHKWTFDEFYTAMAIEGLDKNKDGVYDREELAELAKVNIDGLKDFAYFTYPVLAGKELALGEARDYWLEHKDGLLSLHFTLPFASPVLTEAKGLAISVYDPTYFIAFEPAKDKPARLSEGAPKGCEAKLGAVSEKAGDNNALGALQTQLGPYAASLKSVLVECAGP